MNKQYVKRTNDFSLIELLIVITIMAVAAGGMVTAYGSYTEKAESAQNKSNQKELEKTVRTFIALNGGIDEMDSLLAATTPTAPADSETELINNLNDSLKDKLTIKMLPKEAMDSLINAGVSSARYVNAVANVDRANHDVATDVTIKDETDVDVTVSDGINLVDTPNQIFDYVADGTPSGRGDKAFLSETTPVAIWKPGVHGSNVEAVGGAAGAHFMGFDSTHPAGKPGKMFSDVLVAFGLGTNSSIAGDGQVQALQNQDIANITSVPTYSGGAEDEYGRYILLFNVGNVELNSAFDDFDTATTLTMNHTIDSALLTAVVDAHGDAL